MNGARRNPQLRKMCWTASQFDSNYLSSNLQLIQDGDKVHRHVFRSKTHSQVTWGEAHAIVYLFRDNEFAINRTTRDLGAGRTLLSTVISRGC